MTQLVTDLVKSFKSNSLIIKISAIYLFVIYAYFIFSWNISIDTELATYSLGNSQHLYPLYIQFLKLGRPILGLLTLITGAIPLPFFNSLLALSFVFCSYLIWIPILSKVDSSKIFLAIFGLFYLISPIYIFQLNFVNQIWSTIHHYKQNIYIKNFNNEILNKIKIKKFKDPQLYRNSTGNIYLLKSDFDCSLNNNCEDTDKIYIDHECKTNGNCEAIEKLNNLSLGVIHQQQA